MTPSFNFTRSETVLDMLKQSGAAWTILRKLEKFNDTLSDDQKEMISDIKTSLRGIGDGIVPAEVQPIFHYVLDDNGEPAVVKAIGAVMHPTVRSSLAGLLPNSGSNGGTEADILDDGTRTIKCRECGFVAQYGLNEAS
jgi:predicted Zn-ribbon and HTH transcriptional regulator